MISQVGKLMNMVIFIISIASQLTYFYDAQSGLVEKCIIGYPNTLLVTFSFFLRRSKYNDDFFFSLTFFSTFCSCPTFSCGLLRQMIN